jgi:hypothetical protein
LSQKASAPAPSRPAAPATILIPFRMRTERATAPPRSGSADRLQNGGAEFGDAKTALA